MVLLDANTKSILFNPSYETIAHTAEKNQTFTIQLAEKNELQLMIPN
jgi:hypothetical protein